MIDTPPSLLERLRSPNDEAAWQRFVDLYGPLLYLWMRRLGLDKHDSADLAQEVFLVLVKALPGFQYDRDRSFRAWLHVIVKNKWRDRTKAQRHHVSVEAAERLADPKADEAIFQWEEGEFQRQVLGIALQLIEPEFSKTTWNAFRELVLRGKAATAVAQQLGITPNMVYLAKSRVLRRLRQEIAGLSD